MSRKKGQAVADTRQIGESWQAARMTNASLIQTVTFQMPLRKKHLTCVVSVQLGFAGSLFFFFLKWPAFSSTCILHLPDMRLSLSVFWLQNNNNNKNNSSTSRKIHQKQKMLFASVTLNRRCFNEPWLSLGADERHLPARQRGWQISLFMLMSLSATGLGCIMENTHTSVDWSSSAQPSTSCGRVCLWKKKKEKKKKPLVLTARVTLFCGSGHLCCWVSCQTMQVWFPPSLSPWQSVDYPHPSAPSSIAKLGQSVEAPWAFYFFTFFADVAPGWWKRRSRILTRLVPSHQGPRDGARQRRTHLSPWLINPMHTRGHSLTRTQITSSSPTTSGLLSIALAETVKGTTQPGAIQGFTPPCRETPTCSL